MISDREPSTVTSLDDPSVVRYLTSSTWYSYEQVLHPPSNLVRSSTVRTSSASS